MNTYDEVIPMEEDHVKKIANQSQSTTSSATTTTTTMNSVSPSHSSSSTLPKIKTLFQMDYRCIYAVATQDTVCVYDTQHKRPLVIVGNLHYATFTDIAWYNECYLNHLYYFQFYFIFCFSIKGGFFISYIQFVFSLLAFSFEFRSPDGLTLILASSDGFCSIVCFESNDLGEPIVGLIPSGNGKLITPPDTPSEGLPIQIPGPISTSPKTTISTSSSSSSLPNISSGGISNMSQSKSHTATTTTTATTATTTNTTTTMTPTTNMRHKAQAEFLSKWLGTPKQKDKIKNVGTGQNSQSQQEDSILSNTSRTRMDHTTHQDRITMNDEDDKLKRSDSTLSTPTKTILFHSTSLISNSIPQQDRHQLMEIDSSSEHHSFIPQGEKKRHHDDTDEKGEKRKDGTLMNEYGNGKLEGMNMSSIGSILSTSTLQQQQQQQDEEKHDKQQEQGNNSQNLLHGNDNINNKNSSINNNDSVSTSSNTGKKRRIAPTFVSELK